MIESADASPVIVTGAVATSVTVSVAESATGEVPAGVDIVRQSPGADPGAVVVDEGAARRLREDGKSLLPIGMVAVEGDFSRGDVIAVRDPAGVEIARGLANYASAEARLLCRKASTEIEAVLGFANEPELIHRDNLVLS